MGRGQHVNHGGQRGQLLVERQRDGRDSAAESADGADVRADEFYQSERTFRAIGELRDSDSGCRLYPHKPCDAPAGDGGAVGGRTNNFITAPGGSGVDARRGLAFEIECEAALFFRYPKLLAALADASG